MEEFLHRCFIIFCPVFWERLVTANFLYTFWSSVHFWILYLIWYLSLDFRWEPKVRQWQRWSHREHPVYSVCCISLQKYRYFISKGMTFRWAVRFTAISFGLGFRWHCSIQSQQLELWWYSLHWIFWDLHWWQRLRQQVRLNRWSPRPMVQWERRWQHMEHRIWELALWNESGKVSKHVRSLVWYIPL